MAARTILLALCLAGTLLGGRAADTSSSAIQQTVASASNNPQIAGSEADTGTPASSASSPALAAGAAQQALPSSLQASDVNNALTNVAKAATVLIQNAPPVPRNPPPGISVATNGITLPAAAPGQTLTLNPQGVTFAATPDSPSMTIGNAGVQYNNPVVDSIPAQQADSLFPGEGLSVVQNHALNDAGTGVARAGHTNFQPLGSSVGPLTTPAQNTQATLASLGQGGHGSEQQRAQQQQQMAYGARSQGTGGSQGATSGSQGATSYAAQVPVTQSLPGLGLPGGAAADPNAVTLSGPGGTALSLGRKLLLR